MVGPEDIGRAVVIQAADDFFAFIDGWTGTLDRFESGYAVVLVPGHEDGQDVIKTFYLPPDQVAPQ